MHPKPNPELTEWDIARFWKYVHKTETCWLWTGTPSQIYGQLGINGKNFVASRLSYLIHYGPFSDDLSVCHDCPGGDNPRCVNPDHLFIGTCSDNTRDAINKGTIGIGDDHWTRRTPERCARGDRNGSRTHPEKIRYGENHAQAKLTAQQVRDIRRIYRSGNATYRTIASPYGVTTEYIGEIMRGEKRAEVID